ncbi:methylated-DNA--protein-cysteine methyltransferase [Shewanella denitrificans OS217]|uniref:Methylated-DNA--protein-cysteine methyltransferase n=1 Tax=Shewanella denitrificans (strain OS217 / ATCC BAA-1090 / DSM 15013) TaxID=318161 RepID=Q12L66_SHEDO|nr:methylated-DNA--[protein]-cysteine S-methyltransferase [Shewanella denitrificans]ABE55810.1 methylated-DNA--protein-cysteine methyltransferase [Shewanella denitrificans OS217]
MKPKNQIDNKMPAPVIEFLVSSPVGQLSLKASDLGLTHLQVSCLEAVSNTLEVKSSTVLDRDLNAPIEKALVDQGRAHLELTLAQLTDYFAGKRQHFELPLAPKGTEFQRQVWQALSELNFGQVCSYSDIANTISRPKAVRAVGAANGANPIAIVVPCHRVIGKGGQLTGYAYGLAMKQYLLDLEGVSVNS